MIRAKDTIILDTVMKQNGIMIIGSRRAWYAANALNTVAVSKFPSVSPMYTKDAEQARIGAPRPMETDVASKSLPCHIRNKERRCKD